MWKNNRPDDWIEQRARLESGLKVGGIPVQALKDWQDTYEAGADAILKALLSENHITSEYLEELVGDHNLFARIPVTKMVNYRHLGKGNWVFIPELEST